MAKVTGIGGVFFKAKGDPKALAAWYETHLGMKIETYGGVALRWPEDKGTDKGVTAWQVAADDSKWFAPSESRFMINYRVDDMDGLLANLKQAGVALVKEPETYDQGKFAWIMDPEGNKIELWEP